MTDLVKLYNPANASALTSEQLAGLQKLSSAEIKELAAAYPNMTMQRAYLLIIDGTKPAGKQLPTLSTFENLWNLREKNAQRNFVAFGFKGNYKTNTVPQRQKKVEVLDLSETELLSLPGFKTATKEHPAQEVKVTKINKVVNEMGKAVMKEVDQKVMAMPQEAKTKPAKRTRKTKSK